MERKYLKWFKIQYIQVAYLILDNKVKEREFDNLLKIHDNYIKYIISMDTVIIYSCQGIEYFNLRHFLESSI